MKLAIIIPAYNEASVIGSVLQRLPRRLPRIRKIDRIVIDDGSKDNTGAIARQYGAIVLRHATNLGLGGALGTGLTYARQRGYDLVATMDADGQHDPADLPRLIDPVVRGTADFVVGSRLLQTNGMPWYRRIGNWGLNLFTRLLSGVWTTDSQSGFRVFSRKAISSIEVDLLGMEVSSSFFDAVATNRLHYAEIPVRAIYTDYSLAKGQKNSNGFHILFRLFYHKFLK
jgi:glycosyltransferase involved in cell wall biosynthesis